MVVAQCRWCWCCYCYYYLQLLLLLTNLMLLLCLPSNGRLSVCLSVCLFQIWPFLLHSSPIMASCLFVLFLLWLSLSRLFVFVFVRSKRRHDWWLLSLSRWHEVCIFVIKSVCPSVDPMVPICHHIYLTACLLCLVCLSVDPMGCIVCRSNGLYCLSIEWVVCIV